MWNDCVGTCQGDYCELMCSESTKSGPATGQRNVTAVNGAAPPQCTCNLDEEDCQCTAACSEEVKQATCVELLGGCTCQRSDAAYCECFGYCASLQERKDACSSAFGCAWSGHWCDVVTKLIYNETSDELEASFVGDGDQSQEM